MIFTKSTFSKKHRKNLDFGIVFGGQNHDKSRKNGVENMCFFDIDFFSIVFRIFVIWGRFWEALGLPKINKKLEKSCLGRF